MFKQFRVKVLLYLSGLWWNSEHGVPTPMCYKGVLTDGGEANEFISATSRGRSRN